MSGLYDEDGVDGPFVKGMKRAPTFPLRRGLASTEPQTEDCHHGVRGLVSRWVWDPRKGETEEDSEPEILASPPGCHACNCDDPFCPRCAE